ncbi:MAG: hypothetical protein JXA57_00760, partial [Armatimonadetes bacterium]|nr:hypothetical protein [Armatimonadota bacterium]
MRTRLPVSGCLLLSAFGLVSIASAHVSWQKTYGGADDELGYSVEPTADGGFIAVGSTRSFGAGGMDVYLVKTDAQGDTLWTHVYGGTEDDVGYSVRQTADGGFIVTGYTYSDGVGWSDVYLVKTNAQGDTLWTRTYGGTDRDGGVSVLQTSDGGYVVAGWTASFGTGGDDVYLIRTNAAGDTLWTRTYGGSERDEGSSVRPTTDGGFIVAGHTMSFGAGGEDFYLVKTNASGDTFWTRTYGGVNLDQGWSTQQTADGGYIIAGCTQSFGAGFWDYYLVKADSDGDTLWTRTYGGAGNDLGFAIQQTIDGGYIVVGQSESPGAGPWDILLVKTDAQGDTLWTKSFGEAVASGPSSVVQTLDSGYIVAGSKRSGGGDFDVYLVRLDANIDVGAVATLSPAETAESGRVYVPLAVVRGFNVSSAVFPVTMRIGADYTQTIQETLAARLDTIAFPAWTAGPVGPVPVRCYTSLVGDEDPTNDTIVDSVQVLPPPIHDVGATAILSPSGSVRAGDTLIPRARVRNFGNRSERFFDVRFCIGAGYSQKVNVANVLPADSTAELSFPPWVAESGFHSSHFTLHSSSWAVSCST